MARSPPGPVPRRTPASLSLSTNARKAPRSSGIVDTSIASSLWPEPERDATNLSLSKFMLAPLVMAITLSPSIPLSARYFFAPATARAPEGSVMERVSSKMSLIATHVSSVSTRMTSSTSSMLRRNGSSPTMRTATPSANVSTESSVTRSPASSDLFIASAPVGSTPMILMSGRRRFTYAATPAIRPPPPTGMKIAWMGLVCWRRISIPMVPCPAMTRGWSKGGMNIMLSSFALFMAYAFVSSNCSPYKTTSAPRRRTLSTLMSGVTVGMAMIALQPRNLALMATPCAWLPAEAVMMPLASCSEERCEIMLYAPLILKENTGCMSSRFTRSLFFTRSDNRGMRLRGVSTATSYTLAVKICSRYQIPSAVSRSHKD
mmetsp:Transcript_72229/g.150893  ORF Transcript_72229/g.150893 Transcript_72229/m.150893 type:complete len:375 (+) Transcript_72229:474-1598(+)